MKNRKIVVVAFMLIAAMLMGVGYAALTDTLTLIGNATIDMNQAGNNFDAKVYFSAAEIISSPNESVDTVGGVGTDDATFAAHSLATMGDVAVFKFTITNQSNVPVEITLPEEATNSSDKFDVSYSYSIPDMIIPSQGTMDITVTVEVVKPVTSATTATFNVAYTATTVE